MTSPAAPDPMAKAMARISEALAMPPLMHRAALTAVLIDFRDEVRAAGAGDPPEDYINEVRHAFGKRWPYEVTAELWDALRAALRDVARPVGAGDPPRDQFCIADHHWTSGANSCPECGRGECMTSLRAGNRPTEGPMLECSCGGTHGIHKADCWLEQPRPATTDRVGAGVPSAPRCDHCERPMLLTWVCDDGHPVIWRPAGAGDRPPAPSEGPTRYQLPSVAAIDAALMAAKEQGSVVSGMGVLVPDVRAALFAAYAVDFGNAGAASPAAAPPQEER